MLTVTVDPTDLQKITQLVAGFSERRFSAAVATALTRTAKAARDTVRAATPQYIDRPTPFTQRGHFFSGANARRLSARVWFGRDDGVGAARGKFLSPQIEGGGRGLKRFEKALQARGAMPQGHFAVPGPGAKLDAFGNMSPGQITQILSQVGTELQAGFTRTLRRKRDETAKQFASRRRRAFGRAGGQYVAVPQARGKLRAGIYLAGGRDFGRLGYGRKKGAMVPVLFFQPNVSYRIRFPWYDIVGRVVQDRMGVELRRAVEESADRLRSKLESQFVLVPI